MIIVKLAGGIGNQMFQYACGRALAHHNSTTLALDHSFLEDRTPREGFTYRNYELNAFGIQLKISPLRRVILQKIRRYRKYVEPRLTFDASLVKRGPRQYLQGYFQNEQYFLDISEVIRQDFSFVPVKSAENKELMEKILAANNAVSIHVRRGDYLTINSGQTHGVCSPEYYKNAISNMKQKVKDPTFFVFSADDPEWAKSEFKSFDIPFTVVGEKNTGIYGYENMRMMSLCTHNIIANSSFSWWGAWLNRNPQKFVIGPERWYSSEAMQRYNPCPENWLLL